MLWVAGLGVTGCGSSGGDTDLASVEGVWLIKHDGFGCASLAGALLENTLIALSQNGDRVSADQVDQFGNRYVFDGRYGDGILRGTLTANLATGREVRVYFGTEAFPTSNGAGTQFDGILRMEFDSEGECAIGARIGVWVLPGGSSDPVEVFSQCGPVDIVFLMDTSGSMDDEAAVLCEQLEGVLADLEGLGLTDVRTVNWGINEDADAPEHVESGEFSCLDDNVRDRFNDPIVPGTTDRRIFPPENGNRFEGDEDWGPAISIVAHFGSANRSPNFQWRANAIKIIVPISDEGPSQGDGGGFPDSDDAELIQLAITNATANGVIVSPIVGSGAEPATAQHALDVAAGTGGVAVRSTGETLDLGQVLFDIVFRACGGVPEASDPPAPFAGDTMLIAAGFDGNIYRIDPQTGAVSFLVSTPLGGLGVAELRAVSSMVYDENADQLLAGTGGQADCDGCIYDIERDGTAFLLSDNDELSDSLDAHAGLTQRRSDFVIFGTEGDDDDLWVIGNGSGVAAQYADDMSEDVHERGNGLTFHRDVLYWAGEDHLYRVNQFTGLGTDLGAFSFTNIAPLTDYTVVSMTSPPGSDVVYAIVKDRSVQPRVTYVCTLDVSTRALTVLQPPTPAIDAPSDTPVLDGIAWVPLDFFTPR